VTAPVSRVAARRAELPPEDPPDREPVTPPAPLSSAATTRAALARLEDLDWPSARVADVGAGTGHFSARLGEALRRRGLAPEHHVFPCDRHPEFFRCPGLSCAPVPEGGRLPFDDGSFDAVVSIEVIEHVEDQFAFLRELARIARPGGRVLVTTPNVLSLSSRVRTLVWGFPELFDPLPLGGDDRRRLGGHVHPIAPYYLALAALQAGLERPSLHSDRIKRSALGWLLLLWPALILGRALTAAHLRRKHPDVARENRELLAAQSGFRLLAGRTALLLAHKPRRAADEP
jgi:SAM-dependent methyltransferase